MIEQYRKLQQKGLINRDDSFVPSIHYPSITLYPPSTAEAMYESYQGPPAGIFDIYVHFPFCKDHCTFCHYPSLVGDVSGKVPLYLDMLQKEIALFKKQIGVNSLKARSILIGGGTPTYIGAAELASFLEDFSKDIDLSQMTQFNYDLDPGTMMDIDGLKKLEIMRKHGVDRLTIGINTLNDDLLKRVNRPHNAQVALESIKRAKDMGFKVNIEFIYGLPGQTQKSWERSIKEAIESDPHEIQLYRLKIIPYGDREGDISRERRHLEVEKVLEMKLAAHQLLNDGGYTENLSRVFSKDHGIYSHYAHNQCCMLFDQVGFGVTAFSSLHDRFVLNTDSFENYVEMVQSGVLPVSRGLKRSADDQKRWAMILPLKNSRVNRKRYEKIVGNDPLGVWGDKIQLLESNGLITINETEIELTKQGRFFADEVVQLFYSDQYVPHGRESYSSGELNPYDI